jgi:hypothetical protein
MHKDNLALMLAVAAGTSAIWCLTFAQLPNSYTFAPSAPVQQPASGSIPDRSTQAVWPGP